MAQQRSIQKFSIQAPMQNKFQAWAERLAKAKSMLARANAEVERVKDEFYELADETFGPDTYVVYEARKPHAFMRMAREVQEPRIVDLDMLKFILAPAAFASITKTVPDLAAIDNEVKRKA